MRRRKLRARPQLRGAGHDQSHRTSSASAAPLSRSSPRPSGRLRPPPARAPADQPPDPAHAGRATSRTILVTGSRIRRDPLDQDQPVVFVDRADIDRTGLTSAADVLQRLPSSGGALNSRFNNTGNFGNPPDGGGVGAGAAEVDLRYLGSQRILVLVDGLRYVNGASASGVPGSIDLNSIPESMIERIEVLQDGASAIYGSDAIAGVVNIITRKQQDGLRASAQLGAFGEGDGFTQNYQLSWGAGNADDTHPDRRSAAITSSRRKSARATASISLFPTPGATACDATCSSGTPNGRFIVLGQDLTLIAPVIGRSPTLADYRHFAGAPDRFNFAPFNFIQTPVERWGAFVNFTQELGDDVELNVQALYNRRKSSNQAAPLPLFVGPDAGNGNLLDTIVDRRHQPVQPVRHAASGTIRPLRPTKPPTPSSAAASSRTGRGATIRRSTPGTVAATLDGSFQLLGNDWNWDVNARLRAATRPIRRCTATSMPPISPARSARSPPAPALHAVQHLRRRGVDHPVDAQLCRLHPARQQPQKLLDFSANLTGGLFELPGGTAGIAIGVEHRDLNGRFDPDPVVAAGLGSDIPALPTWAATMSTRPMPNCGCLCFATRPSSTASS